MKSTLPVFIFMVCFVQLSLAQEDPMNTEKQDTSRTRVIIKQDSTVRNAESLFKPCISPFVELLGKGFYSVNLDFRWNRKNAVSIGNGEFLTPDIMYYRLSGERNRFETGGGFSLGFRNDLSIYGLMIHGVFGYRYQKKKGLFFRAGFTPLFIIYLNNEEKEEEDENKFYPFIGLSLGYSF